MSAITAPLATALPATLPADGEPSQIRGRGHWFLRALSTTATVLISLVAVLMIVIAIGTRTSSDGMRMVYGHPVMTVVSGSMSPGIRTGDLIVDDQVTAAQAQHFHVGQVISFRAAPGSKQVITHRIVAVRDSGGAVSYITKGDANNSADSTPRPASDVIGIYRFTIPRGGYALVAVHTPRVLGMLLTSAVLWIVAGVLFLIAARPDNS
jgi:signal peptidase I